MSQRLLLANDEPIILATLAEALRDHRELEPGRRAPAGVPGRRGDQTAHLMRSVASGNAPWRAARIDWTPGGTAALVASWLVRFAAAALIALCGAVAICALFLRFDWHLEELTDGHVLAYPLVLLFLILWPVLEFVCCVAARVALPRRRWPQRPRKWPDRSCSRLSVDPIQRR